MCSIGPQIRGQSGVAFLHSVSSATPRVTSASANAISADVHLTAGPVRICGCTAKPPGESGRAKARKLSYAFSLVSRTHPMTARLVHLPPVGLGWSSLRLFCRSARWRPKWTLNQDELTIHGYLAGRARKSSWGSPMGNREGGNLAVALATVHSNFWCDPVNRQGSRMPPMGG